MTDKRLVHLRYNPAYRSQFAYITARTKAIHRSVFGRGCPTQTTRPKIFPKVNYPTPSPWGIPKKPREPNGYIFPGECTK